MKLSIFGAVIKTLFELFERKLIVLGIKQSYSSNAVYRRNSEIQLVILLLKFKGFQVVFKCLHKLI